MTTLNTPNLVGPAFRYGDLGRMLVAIRHDLVALAAATSPVTGPTTTVGAKLGLLEATDNGTSKAYIKAPDALGADITLTLPSATATLATTAGVATAVTDMATVTGVVAAIAGFKVAAGGTVTFGAAESTKTATVPAGSICVVSIFDDDSGDTHAVWGTLSGTTLTIHADAVPGVGKDAVVAWIALVP